LKRSFLDPAVYAGSFCLYSLKIVEV